MPRPPDIQRGQEITADFLNRSKNHGPNQIRSGPGINVRQQGGDVVVGMSNRSQGVTQGSVYFPVRVTGILPTRGEYSGVQMARQADGTYIDLAGGITFDASSPLVEVNRLPVSAFGGVRFARSVVTSSRKTAEFQSPGQFWAKITASESGGDNVWTYTFTQQVRIGTGLGWDAPDNAWTDTTARNSREANNSAAGIQGNGIDIDGSVFDDNSGLEVQPIQGDPVVWMTAEPDGSGGYFYTFEASNAIDGECG